MLTSLLSRLNRLRLGLGLFRWWNYAALRQKGEFWWVQWYSWLDSLWGGLFKTSRRAIRHIRRCVRLGVRP